MKWFISQPMKDKTKEMIETEREHLINAIRSEDKEAEIIESYFKDYDPKNGCIPLKFLSKSLELLADADKAVFAKGWQDARGCRIEHMAAIEYGIHVIDN